MDEVDLERGALGEAVVFLRFFEDLPDPRQRAKVLYPLDEILLLCLLAVLAGAETMTDIARFGDKNSRSRAASDSSPTARRRMIIWATFSPRSMLRPSSAASSLGSSR